MPQLPILCSVVLGSTLEDEIEGDKHADEKTIEDDSEDDLGSHIAFIAVRITRQKPVLVDVREEFENFGVHST